MKFIWDNSNIVESYPSICSPLTFSFARYVYREVYMQASLLFGAKREFTDKMSRHFETMLGYFDGRFYYNLDTWCFLISHLPGFGNNPKLLQEMMGVRPEDRVEIPPVKISLMTKINVIGRFLYRHFFLPRATAQWIKSFELNLKITLEKLENCSDAYSAMNVFFEMENIFLKKWRIPIMNDFAVMIYSGALKHLYKRLYKKELNPELLSVGLFGNVRMVQKIREIAEKITENPRCALALENGGLNPKKHQEIWSLITSDQNLKKIIEAFISEFGLRNGHNLKLETKNFREDPYSLVNLFAQYARADKQISPVQEIQKVRIRNPLINYLAKHARVSIKNREEMRVKRSQVFGVIREIFVKIGIDFKQKELIGETEDIFFLEMDEVFNIIRGTSTLKNISVLIDQRKRELNDAKEVIVKSHFQTKDYPQFDGNRIEVASKNVSSIVLKGTPNYPAIIKGEVLVMEVPDFSLSISKKILVCRQTDPNWVPLLGLAGGIIVERGGILSHAAIVSRELKLPSIVGVENATSVLKTGQYIEMDSKAGTIKIL